jgi:hypothetical protein
VQKNDDLEVWKLSGADWKAIELICDWLRLFREATEQMSATKHSTLSAAHPIIHSLQKALKTALRKLPDNAPHQLKQGLIKAHIKLSDYHNHFNESPFYLWACCMYFLTFD